MMTLAIADAPVLGGGAPLPLEPSNTGASTISGPIACRRFDSSIMTAKHDGIHDGLVALNFPRPFPIKGRATVLWPERLRAGELL